MHDALHRTSKKVYRKRPPANCLAARYAWDVLAAERTDARLITLRLVEGYWMGSYSDGDGDDVDAIVARDNARLKARA
jgi:hypothetical protein